jgi:hypothetical protein
MTAESVQKATPQPAPAPQPGTPPELAPRSYRGAVLRLTVCSVLFVAWLGYLGYLILHLPPSGPSGPVILSHPQVLVSPLDVVARIDNLDAPIRVEKVLYAAEGEGKDLEGQSIQVENLADCRANWTGPGRYIVPLYPPLGEQSYRVVAIPPSPGYPSPRGPEKSGPPRIYPATPQTLAQYAALPKGKDQ